TDALNQDTSYSYDIAGQQLTQTDALQRTTSYQYDKLGRRVKRILPMGQSETYGYDSVGNLTTHTNFANSQITFSYDVVNRLTRREFNSGFGATLKSFSYTYTTTGRVATITDNSTIDNVGTFIYNYDERDRMIKEENSHGTITYSYDAAGNLISLTSS